MSKSKVLVLGLMVVGLLFGATKIVKAQESMSNQTLSQLSAQLALLQEQLATLQQQQASLANKVQMITGLLKIGASGDEVKLLQALLAEDVTIYPEGLITGFYGPLTAKAVGRFQAKKGLEVVEVVGPKTRAALNVLGSNLYTTAHPFTVKPQSPRLADPNWINTIATSTGTSTPPTGGTSTTTPNVVTICHIPPGNPANAHTINVGAPAVDAHLRHGDTLGACA